jgi:hypothetical protein
MDRAVAQPDPRTSAPSRQPLAIEVVGLRKSFGDLVALDGLDLAVAEGTVVALVGPNRLREDHDSKDPLDPLGAGRRHQLKSAPHAHRR